MNKQLLNFADKMMNENYNWENIYRSFKRCNDLSEKELRSIIVCLLNAIYTESSKGTMKEILLKAGVEIKIECKMEE